MPIACFSYPDDVPRRMPVWACFSYPGAVPPDIGNRGAARATPRDPQGVGYPCFSYPADVPPDSRQMHTGSSCFRY
jgi:hypothetical protein